MDFDFNNLTVDNIGGWPITIKTVILVIIALLLLALAYFFDISSQLDQLSSEQAKELELKTQLESNYVTIKKFQRDTTQAAAVNTLFNELQKQFVTPEAVPAFLQKISKMGANNELKFNLFKPLDEQVENFYVRIPLKIVVVGSYDQLANFISQLANQERFFTFDELKMVPQTETLINNKKVTSSDLALDLTAGIYYLAPEVPKSDTKEKSDKKNNGEGNAANKEKEP